MNTPQWPALLGALGLALVVTTSAPAAASDGAYLDPAQAFRGNARLLDANTVELRIDVTPGYHLYRDRIEVAPEGAPSTLGPVTLPAGITQFDENFQKNVEILRGAVPIRVPVDAAAGVSRIRVTYQGCADQGLCYSPQTARVAVTSAGGRLASVEWQGEEAGLPEAPPASTTTQSAGVESALRSGRWPLIVGVFFVAGLLLSFTPCVLPMLPILSSIIVGQQAPVSRRRGFALALSYSLGMALVYTALGVAAGLLGEGLAAALQNPWVLGAFALLLASLALSMFGVFELQIPGFIQSRLAERSSRLPGGTFAGVFAMGGLSALIVGPCVAAPLAGALVFISQTRDVVVGGAALFCLALGMSVPLLLVGLSAGSLLPRAGLWMERVKVLFGLLLMLVALWIVAPVLPGWTMLAIVGAALIVAATRLGLFETQVASASGRQGLARAAALVLAILGGAELLGALSGGDELLRPLRGGEAGRNAAVSSSMAQGNDFRRVTSVAELDAALRTPGRPVLLDVRADWCVSCKEMERLTFSDPNVRSRMSRALLLQADVTANSVDDKALLRRFGLFGPPGVLLFDASGKEQAAARVVGFLSAERFAESLRAVGL
jgi:thiol:disulfide interchange protein DsbD